MSGLTCCFWWFLFGALLGWLASWLLGKLFGSGGSDAAAVTTGSVSGGLDFTAARASGYLINSPDQLEIIEGIGPVIAHLLRTNGVNSFARLAATSTVALQAILDNGGARFRTANPQTWAEQAALAANNRWADLRRLQDALDHGVRHV